MNISGRKIYREQKKQYKYKFTKLASLFLALVLVLLSGTYALSLFSTQTTTNLLVSVGGRLHDDYDGSDKDIYIENYADIGGEDLFARVRLLEYMELGAGAGTGSNTTILKGGISPTGGDTTPSLSNEDSWYYYKYEGEDAPAEGNLSKIRHYKDLKMGGMTIYMPTFNKVNTDRSTETNGTYEGSMGSPFDDYQYYLLNETKTATASYINEATGTQTQRQETHTAKATAIAEVIPMDEWQALDFEDQVGTYWVYDSDGWFYWAQPIPPQSATGLLTTQIISATSMDEDWYYAQSAVAQIATAGDWGDKDSQTGMYEDGFTEDGMGLLSRVSNCYEGIDVEITNKDGSALESKIIYLPVNETLDLDAKVALSHSLGLEQEHDIVWSLEVLGTGTDNGLNPHQLLFEGYFAVNYDWREETFIIKAASALDPTKYDTVTVYPYDSRYVNFRARGGYSYTPYEPEVEPGYTVVQQKETFQLYGDLETCADDRATWEMWGHESSGTTLTADGFVTIGADEPLGNVIYFRGTSVADPSMSHEFDMEVVYLGDFLAATNTINTIDTEVQSTTQVYIDDKWYYVLDKQIINGRPAALLYPEEFQFLTAFSSIALKTQWEDSVIRSNLQTWLGVDENNDPIANNEVSATIGYAGDKLKYRAAEVELETNTFLYTGATTAPAQVEVTKDKAFIFNDEEYTKYVLSEPTGGFNTILSGTTGKTVQWARKAYTYRYIYHFNNRGVLTTNSTAANNATTYAARPAVWVYLSPEAK